jgi:hypothetical protein
LNRIVEQMGKADGYQDGEDGVFGRAIVISDFSGLALRFHECV